MCVILQDRTAHKEIDELIATYDTLFNYSPHLHSPPQIEGRSSKIELHKIVTIHRIISVRFIGTLMLHYRSFSL